MVEDPEDKLIEYQCKAVLAAAKGIAIVLLGMALVAAWRLVHTPHIIPSVQCHDANGSVKCP